MPVKAHPPLSPRLIGYDPCVDLPADHVARFVDTLVDEHVRLVVKPGPGQPSYDNRMLLKVLLYSYATGVRSSRRMEQNCAESLPYLLLTRGDRPSYRTLCTARIELAIELEDLWLGIHKTAASCGLNYVGKIAVDSMKVRADVSRDSVVAKKDYARIREGFRKILSEAAEVDSREDEEGGSVKTQTGLEVSRLREVIRLLRKKDLPEHPPEPSQALAEKLRTGLLTLEDAESKGLSHVSLTDPDARMMPIGSSRRVAMGHRLEAASDNGLLVVGQAHPDSSDNARLEEIVEMAKQVDPTEITQVVADSGFYSGLSVASLIEDGIEVVVPDSTTAGRMRSQIQEQNQPIQFTKVEAKNAYRCPQGKLLKPDGTSLQGGQRFTQYVVQSSCVDCPLFERCIRNKGAKRRRIQIGEFDHILKPHLAKFASADVRTAYYARGPAIETTFAFMRVAMNFQRWSLRGLKKIQKEASILCLAFQLRKLHTAKTEA
jgi:transposase